MIASILSKHFPLHLTVNYRFRNQTKGNINFFQQILFHRKKFGIQFFLDVIRLYYTVADPLTEEDAQAVRVALLEIIKYYIQKDLNIKEVCVIISYIASVNHEYLIVELLELIWTQMTSKLCLDQLFLLLHEPQTAELCYALLTDRKYSTRLHLTVLKVSSQTSLNNFLM